MKHTIAWRVPYNNRSLIFTALRKSNKRKKAHIKSIPCCRVTLYQVLFILLCMCGLEGSGVYFPMSIRDSCILKLCCQLITCLWIWRKYVAKESGGWGDIDEKKLHFNHNRWSRMLKYYVVSILSWSSGAHISQTTAKRELFKHIFSIISLSSKWNSF